MRCRPRTCPSIRRRRTRSCSRFSLYPTMEKIVVVDRGGGYGIRMSETIDLPVEGMTCASCVNRVSKGLGSVPGVEAADVNLATGRATVTFDPHQATTIDLRTKVEDLGYQSPPEHQHD